MLMLSIILAGIAALLIIERQKEAMERLQKARAESRGSRALRGRKSP